NDDTTVDVNLMKDILRRRLSRRLGAADGTKRRALAGTPGLGCALDGRDRRLFGYLHGLWNWMLPPDRVICESFVGRTSSNISVFLPGSPLSFTSTLNDVLEAPLKS